MRMLSLFNTRSLTSVLAAGLLVVALQLMGCGGDGGTDPEPDPDPTPPAAPSGLNGTSGDAQITLEWNAVSDAETYTVYRATEAFSDVSSATPVGEGLSATDLTDTDVSNGTLYYYRVTATAEDLESDASNQIDLTPFAAPDRP
ncbi:hypothetical protein CRI93_06500 [Longimonas halophila]|uniref:Fibronectin type-III domain-containing protein n=1 Tax=Longimonas halophila TaxID=1469170 RepID=A0A2H3NY34_9BACT|nr:hypothetical protein [Longimonas halophila]PEN07627.1 hypothetical protein CRI93_06500 [Longimonas halophila]